MPKISVGETDALILCGGLGTRFRVVREDIPKALAPVQGTPFIDLLLDDLITQGFRRIILETGHLGYLLMNYVKRRTDAEYIISNEPKPLGTGGAIKNCISKIKKDSFLVINCDTLSNINYLDFINFYKKKNINKKILIGGSHVKNTRRFGKLKINHNNLLTGYYEKSLVSKKGWINNGSYILSKKLGSIAPYS